MSQIELALLSSVAHRTELHQRWSQLIAHATPTVERTTVHALTVASPRRTQLAATTLI